ncbi:MAG: alpha/beta hydrolase [Acetilactobacillus jinshanensis]
MSKWMQHTVELIVACVALIGVAVFYNTYQISMNGHPHHYHLRTARQVFQRFIFMAYKVPPVQRII